MRRVVRCEFELQHRVSPRFIPKLTFKGYYIMMSLGMSLMPPPSFHSNPFDRRSTIVRIDLQHTSAIEAENQEACQAVTSPLRQVSQWIQSIAQQRRL